MNQKGLLNFIRNNYSALMGWSYIKNEYNHLYKLLKNTKRQEILNKTIVFNTVRCFKPILDREFFLGKILALNGAKVIMLLDDRILKHWDSSKIENKSKTSNFEKINLNLYPNYSLKFNKILLSYIGKKILKLGLKTYSDKKLTIIYYSDIIKKNVKCENLEDLKKYAESSTIRFFKSSELDYRNESVKSYYKISLQNSILSKNIGEFISNNIKPDVFITSHGIYSTWGPIFDLLNKRGGKTLVYAGMHPHSPSTHDIYFSDTKMQLLSSSSYWNDYKNKPVTTKMKDEIQNYFKSRFESSIKDTKIYYDQKKEILRIDKNDEYKYHIAMFPNIIWDGNIKDRHIAFKGILDWIITTINYIKNRRDIKLYIKAHPGEVTLHKDSDRILNLIENQIDLNEIKNVVPIPPERRIDTYEFLKSGVDLGICYDGFLAIEMPYLKIPALMCVDGGRFAVEGGNFIIKNKKEYLDFFDNIDKHIEDFHQNYTKFYDNIIRYVYWYLFENTVKLPTLSKKSFFETDLLQLKKEDLTLDQKLIDILNQF